MKRGKRPVWAHSRGSATHNGASEPGKLKVTVWGTSDREPDRKVAVVLGEEDVRRLVGHLSAYGLLR